MCASFANAPETSRAMATVCDKYLVKMENGLNLWLKDTNRKCALIDGSMLCQKTLSQYEDFSKRSPVMSGRIHITCNTGHC